MFKTILVPLDGSKRAETILPHVEDLATGRDSQIVFLRVIEPPIMMASPYDAMPYFDPETAQLALGEAKKYLDNLTKEFSAKGLNARSVLKEGIVVHTIMAVAEEEKADLIAMASHGRTGLARVFYGSVAAGILHQADRPLLLVRSAD